MTLAVYVQPVPVNVPKIANSFKDIENSDFLMTYSSKVALAMALRIGKGDKVVAIGFPRVLNEALARGADAGISVPLCDNCREQARSLLPQRDEWSEIIIGESPDGFFSGASLAGALSSNLKWPLRVISNNSEKGAKGFVSLVRDEIGTALDLSIDIRRIANASSAAFAPSAILGTSRVREKEAPRKEDGVVSGTPDEIASIISRKLRKYERQEE